MSILRICNQRTWNHVSLESKLYYLHSRESQGRKLKKKSPSQRPQAFSRRRIKKKSQKCALEEHSRDFPNQQLAKTPKMTAESKLKVAFFYFRFPHLQDASFSKSLRRHWFILPTHLYILPDSQEIPWFKNKLVTSLNQQGLFPSGTHWVLPLNNAEINLQNCKQGFALLFKSLFSVFSVTGVLRFIQHTYFCC